MIALIASALALDVGVSAGFDRGADPMVVRVGPRVGVDVRVAPWFEAGAAFAYYPIRGQGGESDPDWTGLAKQLLLQNNVSPSISKMDRQVHAVARLHAPANLGGGWTTRAGVHAGVALVHTIDDLVALQACDNSGCDPAAAASQVEDHVGWVAGLHGDVGTERFAVRLRVEQVRYTETIAGVPQETAPVFTGAEGVVWF